MNINEKMDPHILEIQGKKYKGHTKIELTDIETGKKTTHECDNIVTNALKDILSANPFGVVEYSASTAHRAGGLSSILPLQNNFASVVCFAEQLEENPDNYFLSKIPTAFAGARTNTASGASRKGNVVESETGPIDGGYQFVWDFNSEQGNGDISTVCLAPYGLGISDGLYQIASTETASQIFQPVDAWGRDSNACSIYCDNNHPQWDEFIGAIYGAHHIDEKTGKFYKIANSFTTDGLSLTLKTGIRKPFKLPLGQQNIVASETYKSKNYFLKDYQEQTITLSEPILSATGTLHSVCWYKDKFHIISVTEGTSSFLHTIIDPETLETTQEIKSVPNAVFGANAYNNNNSSKYGGIHLNQYPIMKDYIYIWNRKQSDATGYVAFYKININDASDVTELIGAVTYPGVNMMGYNNVTLADQGVHVSYLFAIVDDKIIPASNLALGGDIWHVQSNFIDTPTYLPLKNGLYYLCDIDPWTFSGDLKLNYARKQVIALNTRILTTINNLGKTLTKTEAQTMKITYTLMEVEETEVEVTE